MQRLSRSLVVTLLAAACGAGMIGTLRARADDGRVNPHTIPHVLRYTSAEDISTLNPVLNQQGTLSVLSQLTMAYLVRYDRTNRPVPELATEIPTLANHGISADGKTITYHLRRGVKWSDGAPFTADDVVFSEHVMLNPDNTITSRDGFDKITKIDEPDKYTVVFHLSDAYSSFLPTFFGTPAGAPCLLPKHLLGDLPNINTADYNSLPIGIGPFRYTAWKRGDEIDLEPNPNYWRGRPKLKKIVYKLITDRNTALAELSSGDIDAWFTFGGSYLSRVQSIPNVTVLRQPGYLYNHIDFNVTNPILGDKAVRQALRYAIDRPLIRHKIAHDVGFLQESTVPAPYPGAPKIQKLPFDLAKANALLDNDGWVRGSDGIRVKNGRRLSLEFASSSGSPDVDSQLELIRGWWQQIGVEMTVKRYLASLMFAPANKGGIVLGGHFDVVNFAWGVAPVDDLANVFGCAFIPPAGQNVMHYCNHKLDAYMNDFRHTYDPSKQSADLGKIESVIVDDTPTIVMTSREDLFALNADIKNFHPGAVTFFDDMMNVDI